MYYLFGAGSNCFSIIGFIGKENVKAIVDNNISRIGKKYCDCPIIGFEEFKKKYKGELVIVSTFLFRDEVEKQLEENGIKNYAIFPRIQSSYLSAEQIIEKWKLKKYKTFFFCGESVISRIIIEQLQVKCGELDAYCTDKLNIGESRDKLNCAEIILIMQDELEEKEKNILDPYNNVIWVNDVIKKQVQQRYDLMEKFHDLHKGERCFLIGNGPSLVVKDLETLLKNNMDTFACNNIFDIYGDTKWRPNYYVVADGVIPGECMEEIKQQEICCFMKDFIGLDSDDAIYAYRYYEHDYDEELPRFSENITNGIYRSATVVFDMIQIAVYMGYTEIYLLGVDCNFVKGSKNNYFKASEEPDMNEYTDKVRRMLLAYQSAKVFSDDKGIRIVNATRGGKLEVFERVNFDEIFENKEFE